MKRKDYSDPIFLKLFSSGLSKGNSRRLQIIESAVHFLTTIGIENTSFDVIAARLGTTSSHLIYYFSTKDALLEAVFKFVTSMAHEVVSGALTNSADSSKLLEIYVRANFKWLRSYPRYGQAFLLFVYYSSFRKPYDLVFEQIRAAGAERIAGLLSRERGKATREDRWLAKSIQAVITGYMFDATSSKNTNHQDALEAGAVDAMYRLVHCNAKWQPKDKTRSKSISGRTRGGG